MGDTGRLNQHSYKALVEEDLKWLDEQTRTLEREHIRRIVEWSVEAAYSSEEDLRIRVAELEVSEKQARDAVLRVGRDPRWASFYAWAEDHKDEVLRRLVDGNGALERRCELLRRQLARALEVQREPCDHKGIGKPGCATCDPIVRDAAKEEVNAEDTVDLAGAGNDGRRADGGAAAGRKAGGDLHPASRRLFRS